MSAVDTSHSSDDHDQFFSDSLATADPAIYRSIKAELKRQQHQIELIASETSLERAFITCNKNGIPFDPEKPTVTSGTWLGTSAATTRGFGPGEFRHVGNLIGALLDGLAAKTNDNSAAEAHGAGKVAKLCRRFPIYAN